MLLEELPPTQETQVVRTGLEPWLPESVRLWNDRVRNMAHAVENARYAIPNAVIVHTDAFISANEGEEPLSWQGFLDRIPEAHRQEYNCWDCRRFFNRYANLAVIMPETHVIAPVLFVPWPENPILNEAFTYVFNRVRRSTAWRPYSGNGLKARGNPHMAPAPFNTFSFHFKDNVLGTMQYEKYRMGHRDIGHEVEYVGKLFTYPDFERTVKESIRLITNQHYEFPKEFADSTVGLLEELLILHSTHQQARQEEDVDLLQISHNALFKSVFTMPLYEMLRKTFGQRLRCAIYGYHDVYQAIRSYAILVNAGQTK